MLTVRFPDTKKVQVRTVDHEYRFLAVEHRVSEEIESSDI